MHHTSTPTRLLRYVFTVMLLSLLTLAASAQTAQDVLYFKNGNIIRGTILEQIPGETIRIRTADGNELVFQMSEIARITREEGEAQPQAQASQDAPAGIKNRKGFILGLGLGVGRTSRSVEFDVPEEFPGIVFSGISDGTKSSVVSDFKIGYAPSNQVMIYWQSKAAWFQLEIGSGQFQVDPFSGQLVWSQESVESLIFSAVSGIGATYFFKPFAPSFYVDGTLGFSNFIALSDEVEGSLMSGFGITIGGGYEFARHWVVDLDLMIGEPNVKDYDITVTYNVTTIKLSINWLLY